MLPFMWLLISLGCITVATFILGIAKEKYTSTKPVHFCSFANSKINWTLDRVAKEAKDSGFFTTVTTFSENDIPSYVVEYAKIAPRGYGYWAWKPMIIREMMRRVKDGDIIFYADAGCSIVKNEKTEACFNRWIEKVQEHPKQRLAFQMPHREQIYTKMDLLNFLNATQEMRQSGQYMATVQIYVNTPDNQAFVDRLIEIDNRDGHHLIDDTPSIAPNSPNFVEHRHDQSVFSLCCKIYGVCTEDAGYNGHPDWPVHITRLR